MRYFINIIDESFAASSVVESEIIGKAVKMLRRELKACYDPGVFRGADLTEMCREAISRFNRYLDGDKVEVWRVITAPADWSPGQKTNGKVKPLGLYWSWDRNAAAPHGGDYRNGDIGWIMNASIAIDDVDWPMTIAMNATPCYEDECEIRLIKGRKVYLHWYQKEDDPSSRVIIQTSA